MHTHSRLLYHRFIISLTLHMVTIKLEGAKNLYKGAILAVEMSSEAKIS